MSESIRIGRDTISVEDPGWNGKTFADATARRWWDGMSPLLREITLAEVQQGNVLVDIVRNEIRNVTIISLELPPRVPVDASRGIRIHTKHEYGNYCYDDTCCTYEDVATGDFLCFENPEFVDEWNPSR